MFYWGIQGLYNVFQREIVLHTVDGGQEPETALPGFLLTLAHTAYNSVFPVNIPAIQPHAEAMQYDEVELENEQSLISPTQSGDFGSREHLSSRKRLTSSISSEPGHIQSPSEHKRHLQRQYSKQV